MAGCLPLPPHFWPWGNEAAAHPVRMASANPTLEQAQLRQVLRRHTPRSPCAQTAWPLSAGPRTTASSPPACAWRTPAAATGGQTLQRTRMSRWRPPRRAGLRRSGVRLGVRCTPCRCAGQRDALCARRKALQQLLGRSCMCPPWAPCPLPHPFPCSRLPPPPPTPTPTLHTPALFSWSWTSRRVRSCACTPPSCCCSCPLRA